LTADDKLIVGEQRSPEDQNPYPALFWDAVGDQADLRAFTWRSAFTTPYDVFHVEFPEHFAREFTRRRRLRNLLLAAALRLALAIRRVPVVRTVHNATPHARLPLLSRLTFELMKPADQRVYLTNCSRQAAADPTAAVIPHGSYRSRFAHLPKVERAQPPKLLLFGLLRAYKGIEDLIRAYGEWGPSDVGLDIIGREDDPGYAAELAAQAGPGVRVDNRFVPDDELWGLIQAATLVVLPYRQITNSGALILALDAGTPVLMSDSELAREMEAEFGGYWVRRYAPPLTGETLRAAVAAAQASDPEPADMSTRDWKTVIAPRYLALYRSLARRR
jgi:beta-1,4-mannosyltransferase